MVDAAVTLVRRLGEMLYPVREEGPRCSSCVIALSALINVFLADLLLGVYSFEYCMHLGRRPVPADGLLLLFLG